MTMSVEDINQTIVDEIEKANGLYGPFSSTHEGLGVLMEEFDELRAAVRENNLESVRLEAMQIAAVATRIAYSINHARTRLRSMER